MFDAKHEFLFGKDDFQAALKAACEEFKLDVDEEECITSTQKPSCYNCLYRRWTSKSFICMKWLSK